MERKLFAKSLIILSIAIFGGGFLCGLIGQNLSGHAGTLFGSTAGIVLAFTIWLSGQIRLA